MNETLRELSEAELEARRARLYAEHMAVRDELESRKPLGFCYEIASAVGAPADRDHAIGLQVRHPTLGRFYVAGFTRKVMPRSGIVAEVHVASDKARLLAQLQRIKDLLADGNKLAALEATGLCHVAVPLDAAGAGLSIALAIPPALDAETALVLAVARGMGALPGRNDELLSQVGAHLLPQPAAKTLAQAAQATPATVTP